MFALAMRPLAHRYFVFRWDASDSVQTLYLWAQPAFFLRFLFSRSREEPGQADHATYSAKGFTTVLLGRQPVCLVPPSGSTGFRLRPFANCWYWPCCRALYAGWVWLFWPNLPALNQMTLPICLAFALAMAARFFLRVFLATTRPARLCQWPMPVLVCLGINGAHALLSVSPCFAGLPGTDCPALHYTLACIYWLRSGRAGGSWYCASWGFYPSAPRRREPILGPAGRRHLLVWPQPGGEPAAGNPADLMVCQRVKLDYSSRLNAEFAARAEQSRAIEQEQAQAQQLAQAVEEKTAALQAALCEVSKLNMELSNKPSPTALPACFNRRHFDHHLLDSEVRRAARSTGRSVWCS